jgi:hypothetical protein
MEPSTSASMDVTETTTLTEVVRTLRALQEQVLQMQERHEEAMRNTEMRTGVRSPSAPMSDAVMQGDGATNYKRKITSGPKPAQPTEFDGERIKGRAFLNSVKWYMRSRGDEFRDDAHRIAWTLSYMKDGRALTFANQITRHTETEGALPYEDWAAFWKELEERFLPLDESEEAMNLLETDRYFQGKKSVDDYCDHFQDLVDHAGYTDGKQVVMKFRKGLESTVADAVATLKEGRPTDDDLAAWIKAAKDIARQRLRNEAFNSAVRRDKPQVKTLTSTSLRPTTFPRGGLFFSKEGLGTLAPKHAAPTQARPQPPPDQPPPNPKPKQDGPIPMEVDASRQQGHFPVVCHRCGQTGHYKNACPRHFDVGYLSASELEERLQEQLAIEDAADVMGNEAVAEEGEDKGEEDFRTGNES